MKRLRNISSTLRADRWLEKASSYCPRSFPVPATWLPARSLRVGVQAKGTRPHLISLDCPVFHIQFLLTHTQTYLRGPCVTGRPASRLGRALSSSSGCDIFTM